VALIATPGDASANAYLTLAEADAYAVDDMGPEADRWSKPETTVDERERAIRRATLELDAYLRTGHPPYSGTQALRFPRLDVDVDSGGSPIIPASLKRATYHQAAYVLLNAKVIDGANARAARGQSSYSDFGASGTEKDPKPSPISDRALTFLSGYRTASAPATRTGLHSLGVDSGFPR
jgi:hypothetical protein